MGNLSSNVQTVIQDALLDFIHTNNPTLTDIVQLAEGEVNASFLLDLPLRQIVADVPTVKMAATPRRTASGQFIQGKTAAGRKRVTNRTPEGRQLYETAILTFLRKTPGKEFSAQQIRRRVGGSVNQFRVAATTLLARRGGVKKIGNTASTRYFVRG